MRTTTEKSRGIAPRPMARRPTHPGEILEEMLADRKLAAMAAARTMGVSSQRLYDVIKGRRGVSAETAISLSELLGTTPEFWMNLQTAVDLWDARQARKAS